MAELEGMPMVGLVVVSHSAKLAEGARDLAQQMTGDSVRIGVAGGIDDPDNPIGTDPIRVMEAITEVYDDSGVVVLMDLGSALMSAEMALEFVDPDWTPNIHLCEAPLVEGLVAAAVQASIGGDAASVLAEARGALIGKQQHLAPALSNGHTAADPVAINAPTEGPSLTITVPNAFGIHARPAARIVKLAAQFEADLTITKDNQHVSGSSINQVTLLGAKQGDNLQFNASGPDADAMLAAVQKLAFDNFGDDDNAPTTQPKDTHPVNDDLPEGAIGGIPASRGLAIGTVFLLDEQLPGIPLETTSDPAKERQQLENAVQSAIDSLSVLIAGSNGRIGAEAAIFEAHALMLQDDELLQPAYDLIQNEHLNAASAWWHTIEAVANSYHTADSELLRGRASDVLDVGKRVLRELLPNTATELDIPENAVIVADDLTPSQTAELAPSRISAIVTAYGGATSHTAIIARTLGIPAVAGIGNGISALADGAQVVVDGDYGVIHVKLSPTQLADYEAQIAALNEEKHRRLAASTQPAVTRDGCQIEIVANVGKASDTNGIAEMGAEGIGLFRTELLFMDRPVAPTEDEQYREYCTASRNLPGRPIIVRTLDVGGDKAIDYIHIAPEANPFLGYRGVRYWLGATDLARTQLRAICRASANHPIRVMFPMVGTVDELLAAKALLREVQQQLDAEGAPHNPDLPVGIMVEVPAAVQSADQLAEHVDFFSIGTNDLTQYIMAADRGNPSVANLISPFQPAVLRAIKTVVDAAHAQGKWVGMCGEMAGNPLATTLLVGLGLDELSMSAPAIPEVKANIREIDTGDAKRLAEDALTLGIGDRRHESPEKYARFALKS
jgi:phosphoenolpyruvate-protein phosphotransferase/dihydroxyacetone kinase phosphotransfer subunit